MARNLKMCYNLNGDFMESIEFYDALYALRDILMDADERLAVDKAYRQIEDDPESNERLKTYIKAKKAYEKAKKYGKHYPGYKETAQAFSEAKRVLQTHEHYKAYMQRLNALNEKLKRLQDGIQEILDSCKINSDESCKTNNALIDGKGQTPW